MGRIITRRGLIKTAAAGGLGIFLSGQNCLEQGHPFNYSWGDEEEEDRDTIYSYRVDWLGNLIDVEGNNGTNMEREGDGEYAKFRDYAEFVAHFSVPFDEVKIGMKTSHDIYMKAQRVLDVHTYRLRKIPKSEKTAKWYGDVDDVLDGKFIADPNSVVRGWLTAHSSHYEQTIKLNCPERMIYVGFDSTDFDGNKPGAIISIDFIRCEE